MSFRTVNIARTQSRTIIYLNWWIIKTNNMGWLFADNLDQALLIAMRMKAIGYTAKIVKNPNPTEVYRRR